MIRVTMEQIERDFGERIWYVANRSYTGIWDATDVYHQLLIAVCDRKWPRRRTWDIYNQKWQSFNPGRIIQLVEGRAKDIIRSENRRKTGPLIHDVRTDSTSPLEAASCNELVLELMSRIRNPFDLQVLRLLVDPDCEVHKLMLRDHQEAHERRRSGCLAMYVRVAPPLLKRHIAERLGVSGATLSRSFKRLRAAAVA